MNDLTTEEGIKALMASSNSYYEWLKNCAKVKLSNGWTYDDGPHWICMPMLCTPALFVERYLNTAHCK